MSPRAHTYLGYIYGFLGRHREGIEHLENIRELFPDQLTTHWFLSWNHTAAGHHADAVVAIERAKELHPAANHDPLFLCSLAWAYSNAGRAAEASAALDRLEELSRTRYVSPSSLGFAYYVTGDHDRWFEQYERALEIHDTQLWAFVTPQLVPFRDDPRCRSIRRRMGLPEG